MVAASATADGELRYLTFLIAKELNTKEVGDIKYLVGTIIPDSEKEQISDGVELFSKLEKRLGHDEFIPYLMDLLLKIGRKDLCKRLEVGVREASQQMTYSEEPATSTHQVASANELCYSATDAVRAETAHGIPSASAGPGLVAHNVTQGQGGMSSRGEQSSIGSPSLGYPTGGPSLGYPTGGPSQGYPTGGPPQGYPPPGPSIGQQAESQSLGQPAWRPSPGQQTEDPPRGQPEGGPSLPQPSVDVSLGQPTGDPALGQQPMNQSPCSSDQVEAMQTDAPEESQAPEEDSTTLFGPCNDQPLAVPVTSADNDTSVDMDSGSGGSIPVAAVTNSDVSEEHLIYIRQEKEEAEQRKVVIELRGYQRELAVPALDDRNCIICAPTGSGKTLTAAHVCHQLRERRGAEGGRFKALFIVCIHNLVQQQAAALRLLFPGDGTKEVCAMSDKASLKDQVAQHDITVLTAQILINTLRRTALNEKMQLSDFDLIVFDECHHAMLLHPYNYIMNMYHEAKRGGGEGTLPQIVGLTASLGCGPGKEPIKHYIHMCANLDCVCITHVTDEANVREMDEFNPRPDENQVIPVLPRRTEDLFVAELKQLMEGIFSAAGMEGSTPPSGGQAYEQWAVLAQKGAEERGIQGVTDAAKALQFLNTALMTYREVRAEDVVQWLRDKFQQTFLADEPIPVESQILNLFYEALPRMKALGAAEELEENGLLSELIRLMSKIYKNKPDSKGIILTRRRFTVLALLRYLPTCAPLQDRGVRAAQLVGQGRRGGIKLQTSAQQQDVLSRFRLEADKGDSHMLNLLVATDVAQEGLDMPKCNFVIRYNFVSNEIGSVQSRGRARAPNSECYLIVDSSSVDVHREQENIVREYLMMEALNHIDRIRNVPQRVTEEQERQWQLWQERLRKREAKRTQGPPAASISLHCRGCNAFLCCAADMRFKGSAYICVDGDFTERVDFTELSEPRDFKYSKHTDHVLCKDPSCRKQLGYKIVYQNSLRMDGYAIGKDGVKWRQDGQTNFRTINKWSKVPFYIEEEDSGD